MKKYIFLILLLTLTLLLNAQKLNYQVEKPKNVYIGTPIKLHVEILTDPADSVFSTVADSLDIFLLQGDIIQSEELVEDVKKINQTLVYQPFNTGEYTFPALEYTVKTSTELTTLQTSEFQVNVLSSIPDSAQAIKDISDPVKINLGFWDYFIPIIVLILMIFLIKYLLKFLKDRRRTEPEQIKKNIRPAWEIALAMLKKLEDSGILVKGDFLNYHYQLSLILRSFLELHYDVKAVEMTTREIRSQLVLDDHKEKTSILKFLIEADKIKFAKFPTNLSESRKAHDWLHNYLLKYKNIHIKKARSEELNV